MLFFAAAFILVLFDCKNCCFRFPPLSLHFYNLLFFCSFFHANLLLQHGIWILKISRHVYMMNCKSTRGVLKDQANGPFNPACFPPALREVREAIRQSCFLSSSPCWLEKNIMSEHLIWSEVKNNRMEREHRLSLFFKSLAEVQLICLIMK